MILASLQITENADGTIMFELLWGKNKATKKEKVAIKAVKDVLEKPLNDRLDTYLNQDFQFPRGI